MPWVCKCLALLEVFWLFHLGPFWSDHTFSMQFLQCFILLHVGFFYNFGNTEKRLHQRLEIIYRVDLNILRFCRKKTLSTRPIFPFLWFRLITCKKGILGAWISNMFLKSQDKFGRIQSKIICFPLKLFSLDFCYLRSVYDQWPKGKDKAKVFV